MDEELKGALETLDALADALDRAPARVPKAPPKPTIAKAGDMMIDNGTHRTVNAHRSGATVIEALVDDGSGTLTPQQVPIGSLLARKPEVSAAQLGKVAASVAEEGFWPILVSPAREGLDAGFAVEAVEVVKGVPRR